MDGETQTDVPGRKGPPEVGDSQHTAGGLDGDGGEVDGGGGGGGQDGRGAASGHMVTDKVVRPGLPPEVGGWPTLVEHAESLGPDPLVGHLSDAALETELRRSAGAVAAATARLLVLVGELVVRGVWCQGGGATTPGQWLSWAIGMAPSTAREHVRVALALRTFTATRDRFLSGSLSYSKVRAITRAGQPGLEAMLLTYADNATAAQLERIVSSFTGLHQPADAHTRRGLTVRQPGDGLTTFTLAVPDQVAGRVQTLIDRLVTELDASGQPRDHDIDASAGGDACSAARPDPLSTRRADAVVHGLEVAVDHLERDLTGAARTTLVLHGNLDSTLDLLAHNGRSPRHDADRRASAGTSGASAGSATPDRTGTTASAGTPAPCRHTIPDPATAASAGTPTLSDTTTSQPRHPAGDRIGVLTNDHGAMVAISSRVLRQLACDPSLCRVTTANGLPIDVGNTTRTITHALRMALSTRDRTCRFPGCAATRHLHAHHIIHWANGGPTDLDNLVLLCGAHHRFIHANDWTITNTGHNRYAFTAPHAATAHPNRLAAVPAGRAASAEAAARHDPRGLEPPGYTGPDWDLDACLDILTQELARLPDLTTAA